MKPPNLIAALLLVLALPFMAAGAEKPKGKKAKDKPAAEKTSSGGLDGFSTMIPLGVRNLRVRIPGFQDGKPSSLIVAEAMTRVDDQNLFAEGLTIHLYGKEPKDSIKVEMKTATYNMQTKILTSREASKITRQDLTTEGDALEFDTVSGQGKLFGHVHTLIYNKPKPAPAPAPKPEEKTLPQAAPAASPATPPQ